MADNVFSIASSGLRAAALQVNVTANNIANMRTNGNFDETAPQAFQAQDVVQNSLPSGGVEGRVVGRDPKSLVAFDPNSPLADALGRIRVPNISLENEMVSLISAKYSYQASLKILDTKNDMTKQTLDIIS